MDMAVEKFRKNFRENVVPKYYWPLGHVVFNFSTLILLCVIFLLLLKSPTLLEWLTIPVMMVVGNLAVFLIHKYPLHRRYPFVGKHTYDIHSKMHHQFYTNEAVIYEEPRDFYILFFPVWTVLGFAVFFVPLVYFFLSPFVSENVVLLVLFSSSLYFLLYECIHYVSHLPQESRLLKLTPLRYMWRHHRVHHDPKLMRDYNFNIVWPLCDWLFGATYKGGKEHE